MTINRDNRSKTPAEIRSPAEAAPVPSSYLDRRRQPVDIADVADLVLGKGLVLDSYLQGAAIGLQCWTIDSRMTIARFDTYLRWSDSVNPMARDGAGTR